MNFNLNLKQAEREGEKERESEQTTNNTLWRHVALRKSTCWELTARITHTHCVPQRSVNNLSPPLLSLSSWIDGVFINQSISLTQSAISCSLESFTCIRTTLHAEGEQQRIFTLQYPVISSSMSHLINTHCKPYPTSLSTDYWVQARKNS